MRHLSSRLRGRIEETGQFGVGIAALGDGGIAHEIGFGPEIIEHREALLEGVALMGEFGGQDVVGQGTLLVRVRSDGSRRRDGRRLASQCRALLAAAGGGARAASCKGAALRQVEGRWDFALQGHERPALGGVGAEGAVEQCRACSDGAARLQLKAVPRRWNPDT